jgi:hypothetical protein
MMALLAFVIILLIIIGAFMIHPLLGVIALLINIFGLWQAKNKPWWS